MRILFLIAMLAAVGLVGWLWIESVEGIRRSICFIKGFAEY